LENLKNIDDFEIIRRILAGEQELYGVLQKRYKSVITTLIRKMIKDEDDVQDLVQETFIKAYNALERFQFGYSFSSWIYRIASNNCIDFMRKRRFATVSIDQPLSGNSEDEYTFEIKDETYLADSTMLSKEKSQILVSAIDSLPENYRQIIFLRHTEELDYQEIANKLEIPLGTVKAHLFRARKLLYDKLKDYTYMFNQD
jgi:RNA polymerase sigma-70 factor (ECF subfamily)